MTRIVEAAIIALASLAAAGVAANAYLDVPGEAQAAVDTASVEVVARGAQALAFGDEAALPGALASVVAEQDDPARFELDGLTVRLRGDSWCVEATTSVFDAVNARECSSAG